MKNGWRAWVPAFAVGLPIVLALGFVFLYTDGAIGLATTIAACFALGAIAVTALLLHGDDDGESDAAPWMGD